MLYAINAAPINGWQTLNASGAAALALAEAGNGVLAAKDTGSAALALTEAGSGSIAIKDTGAAPLALQAAGGSATAVQDSGSLQMVLAAGWNLPNPLAIPGTYSATHAGRLMLADEQQRTMVVPAELIRPVQSELRTMRVSAQKRA